jgi:hypothetical protein
LTPTTVCKMLKSLVIIAVCVGMALPETSGQASADEPFSFIAFGDMPYNKTDRETLKAVGASFQRQQDPYPFAVFYGDMQAGGEKCTEELYRSNRDQIFAVTTKPLFLTFGDNDWTDCDRQGDDELKKLKEARRILLDPTYLPENRIAQPQPWDIVRSETYPELVRWQYSGVVFAAFHIVGTDNGRRKINVHDENPMKKKARAEVGRRDQANEALLDDVFAGAADMSAAVVVMHADPIENTKYKDAQACAGNTQKKCHPFSAFLKAVANKARTFGKPVLLIHGSTEDVCVSINFLGVPNLTRFNGPGDGVSDLAVVSVDVTTAGKTFAFSGIRAGTISKACNE